MSEEILKALMQLFAIISKQDEGVSAHIRKYVFDFLNFQLAHEKVEEYIKLFDEFSQDKTEKKDGEEGVPKVSKLTSVRDSVKTLALCRKINKTLSQKQKIVVLVRLWEMLRADNDFSLQRVAIITTVAEAFNIAEAEAKEISTFCQFDDSELNDTENNLVIDNKETGGQQLSKHIYAEGLHGSMGLIKVPSAELYFIKYKGSNEIYLNGLLFNSKNIYLLPPGSTIRLPQGVIYFSDVVSRFMSGSAYEKISFNAQDLEFKFPNGALGLRNINISEESGKLVAIMGGSGAGKTTLLNVLSGIESPSAGSVTINGINLHKEKQKVEGIIGYIAQDDLLIEELTVFENLYFNTKLCFKDKSEEEIVSLVDRTLNNLGLFEIKDIVVGNPLNKKISGGQRKRLNIALELIREPAVLFVDEPTSGLSSRDSENVMDLLKELTLKGKLIFVVIHQPSSDIFKMFDKLFLLDTGGYSIYYGNPIEGVIYFKQQTSQINAEHGECHTCGTVNPELLFNIIEAKVVDDFGHFTHERKIKPAEWNKKFTELFTLKRAEVKNDTPARTLNIPGRLKQWWIFLQRDVKAKVSNAQYLLINLIEAPLLAFILAIVIRYTGHSHAGGYKFFYNENIPAYIFICIVVALFIGLTVSAEEIYKDRKILKREKFLSLSKAGYLYSKIAILFTISAVQSAMFVLIGNAILGISGMFLPYWLMLFSVACFANVLGLNISVTFNSAVTIYIIIPLLVIPQMIFGGAMFSFDKINEKLGGGGIRTPLIADLFVSRWAFEAVAVEQFKANPFGKKFYMSDKKESYLNYKQAYYLPKLTEVASGCKSLLKQDSDSAKEVLKSNLTLLFNEISKENKQNKKVSFGQVDALKSDTVNKKLLKAVQQYLEDLNEYYIRLYNDLQASKATMLASMQNTQEKELKFIAAKEKYTNDYLTDLVRKNLEKEKILVINNRLYQNIDPVFLDPLPASKLNFRTHFFAPRKQFAGKMHQTFLFNISVIWIMTIVLYFTLYTEMFKRIIDGLGSLFSRFSRKEMVLKK